MLPVSIPKITSPYVPRLLFRPRLIERLEQQQDKKLILILGPAAQGKSALALSFIITSRRPSAWINLGPEDSDPVNLFQVIVLSLQKALPDLNLSPLLQYPAVSIGPREELSLYRDWILGVFNTLSTPVQMVLDGLDRLNSGAASFRFLQVFLDHLPPHLQLFILSREMHPLGIQDMQIRQTAFILTGKELAFTLKETKQFFKKIRDIPFPSDLVERLHQLTEGWIGGLVLLSQSLERIPKSLREQYLKESVEHGRRDIFKYFAEEIFAARPPQIQEFLLKSSLLEVVEPSFIQDFLGLAHAQEILEDLAQKNLFIQLLLDPQKGWLYRYHQLFRDFLLDKFHSTLGPSEQHDANYQVASLFVRRGELKEALPYYFQAQAYPEAANLLEKIGLDLLAGGQIGDLARLLQALPEDVIQERPWLLFFHYASQRLQRPKEVIQSLYKAYGEFDRQGDVQGVLISLAYLLESAIFVRNFPGDFPALLTRAKEILDSLAPDAFPHEKAALWFQLSLVTTLHGNSQFGYQAAYNAYLLAQDLGDIPLQINALLQAYFPLTVMGEFSSAQECRRKVEKLLKGRDYPELVSLHLLMSAVFWLWQGELVQAEVTSKKALAEIEKHGLLFLYPRGIYYVFMALFLQGKFTEAESHAQVLAHMSETIDNPYLKGYVDQVLAMACYHQGDLSGARKIAEQSLHYLTLEINFISFNKLLLSMVAYHLDEITDEVERNLQEALQYFYESSYHLIAKETHLAAALVSQAQGRLPEAAQHLEAGCRLALERNHFHFFFLTPCDLVRVSSLALELQVDGARDFASRLLVLRRVALHAGPDLARLSQHPTPQIARQAKEIRQTIHRQGLPRLSLQTLGGFRLWQGDEPLGEDAWDRPQPKLLLKAVLARGPGGVVKDVIMEDLWPEAPLGTAERNLKTNLHRLRKTLEPSLDTTLGSGSSIWRRFTGWPTCATSRAPCGRPRTA